MKNALVFFLFFCITLVDAQQIEPSNKADFKLGDGLNFSFNNGDYQFSISGFMQPNVNYQKAEDADPEYRLNSKRTFFMLSGKAVNEKVSFLIQNDFSLRNPLLDAWIAYHPYEWLTITGGQKQTFLNNREMTYREDRLQFTERNLLSQTFSNTGREFGLFVESRFGEKFGIAPSFAITSGDGRNSFGADSRDPDLGGMKYGARLDLYPLGYFTPGNDLFTADLAHEPSLKVLVGAAFSMNVGASNEVGEGHGDFFLFDENGSNNLPDYRQAYIDLLLKYQGFSFLAEYANASATNLDGTFINAAGNVALQPRQISQYLVLGDSFSLQTGYVTKTGYSLDVRYEESTPEFADFGNSLLTASDSFTLGLAKYFDGNNLKIQASVQQINFDSQPSMTVGEVLIQIVF